MSGHDVLVRFQQNPHTGGNTLPTVSTASTIARLDNNGVNPPSTALPGAGMLAAPSAATIPKS